MHPSQKTANSKAAIAKATSGKVAGPGRLRILFVDDKEGIRQTFPPTLKEEGFEVRVASSVAEALAEIDASAYDVLLADLNMQEEGDGWRVVGAMRRLHPECINLILTGYPGFKSALQAIRHGASDYSAKPADKKELITRIRELLNARSPKLMPAKRPATILPADRRKIKRQVVFAMKRDPLK
jgi:DNA-binding NtrC family response regulator